MKRKAFGIFAILILLVAVLPAATAGASRPISDTSPRQDSPDYNKGQPLPFDRADSRNAQPPLGPAKIGESKTWLGLDDQRGVTNLKNDSRRGVGTHVEVWVGNNLNFPNT